MATRRRTQGADALAILEQDHRRVETLFRRFDKESNKRARTTIVRELISELGLHAAIEEQVLYPLARSVVPALRPVVLASLEEHHVMKRTLAELPSLDVSDEHLPAKIFVLRANVKLHVEREESQLFPPLRRALTTDEMEQLRVQLERAQAAYSGKTGKLRRRRAA